MNIPPPTKVFPLQRRAAGEWRTCDGMFDFVMDPTSPELGIGDYTSMPRRVWYVFPTRGAHPSTVDIYFPVFVRQTRAWATLREAAHALEAARTNGFTVDAEPAD